MTQSEINKIFDETVETSRAVMCGKADEYVGMGDRLNNFKRAAQLQNVKISTALGGMMSKHTVSVYDMIDRYESGEEFSEEKWCEKIHDHLNYLILLKAVLAEQRKGKDINVPTTPQAPIDATPVTESVKTTIALNPAPPVWEECACKNCIYAGEVNQHNYACRNTCSPWYHRVVSENYVCHRYTPIDPPISSVTITDADLSAEPLIANEAIPCASDSDIKPRAELIYLARPYGGLQANYDIALKEYHELTAKYPDKTFISPIVAFHGSYEAVSYEDGMAMCLTLLEKCDQLWYGQDSRGVGIEKRYAYNHDIEVHQTEEYL